MFQAVAPYGDVEYWATSDLHMTEEQREVLAKEGWRMEVYHRATKQCCGGERAQARSGQAQQNHLLLGLRVFLRWRCIACGQGTVGMRQRFL